MFQTLASKQISAPRFLIASFSPHLLPSRPSFASSFTPVQPKLRTWVEVTLHKPHLLAPGFSQRANNLVVSSSHADGEEDMDEDIKEEELDALFDELGEVVYADPNPMPPSAEVDEDSASLAFAVALAEAANEVKAADIMVLHVKPLVYWARFFVIATAFSRPQVDAVGQRMRDIAEQQYKAAAKGDTKPNSWTLLDFGDVIVHIFLPKERAYYNLEEFYANATAIDLPFKSRATTGLG